MRRIGVLVLIMIVAVGCVPAEIKPISCVSVGVLKSIEIQAVNGWGRLSLSTAITENGRWTVHGIMSGEADEIVKVCDYGNTFGGRRLVIGDRVYGGMQW